ncbi:hypothetical protein Plhal304r1_c023g0079891 [Plasmopara halstedii]
MVLHSKITQTSRFTPVRTGIYRPDELTYFSEVFEFSVIDVKYQIRLRFRALQFTPDPYSSSLFLGPLYSVAVALCANVKSAYAADDINVLHGKPIILAVVNAKNVACAITTRLLRGQ